MKRVFTMLLVMIITLSALPAEAACTTPGCVKRAALTAMDEAGSDVCLVIKPGKDGKSTGYMMYRYGKSAKCDRSGQVIVGRNEHIDKSRHYFFMRNREIEKKIERCGNFRWRYTSVIDCIEEPECIKVHSYIEYKKNGTWKTCKGVSKNTDGISMCKEFAHYLWSFADPGCPVVFM